MRYLLILALVPTLIAPIVQAQPIQSHFPQGYQQPGTTPVKKGFTKNGKRYGNCKSYRHRLHKHCRNFATPPQQTTNDKGQV